MAKMSISAEAYTTPSGLPEGQYNLRIEGVTFKPSKAGDSVNMKWEFRVIGGEKDGEKQTLFLNSKMQSRQIDLAHAAGFDMQDDGSGGKELPGVIAGPDGIENAAQWTYQGPLIGATIPNVQIVKVEQGGKSYGNIKFFPCQLPGCAQKYPELRHTTDWTK